MLLNVKRRFVITILCITCSSVSAGTYQRGRSNVCDKTQFECSSGQCIAEEKLCDGTEDCSDGSDETNDCVNIIPCSSHFLFQCGYGACIDKKFQCDGKNDCKDGSDESEAACGKCGRTEKFVCGSGECINDSDVCDGIAQCRDKSDEVEKVCAAMYCPLYTYRCKYGACVNRNARCNGVIDCADSSDEDDCNFEPTVLEPKVPKPHCQKDEFRCTSGKCVKEERVCDGKKDCDDGSEEVFEICAFRRCSSTSFTCNYGACVPKRARCNGVNDCWDASDEQGCGSQVSRNESTGCIVPIDPQFGNYEIPNAKLGPGHIAPAYSILIPKCNKGYGVTPPEYTLSVCLGGKWTPDLQHCTRTCPLIESTSPVECKFNNKPLKTCDKAVQSTIALVQCDPGADGVVRSIVNFCRNGLWDSPVNQCLPITQNNFNSTYINIFYIFNSDKNN
ncbi:hypothetical protein RN001_010386 [Aquatica leii]|uniref:Uncharacterized protein n=1 Tax=Aquatica leii TaxID=1421715 RepID=A0AAN7Q381_9COLE|nr:hypothetical protein RN001_010386 [Aquatica leii]